MRSPFYYFRKRQKLLLAVFGVALMIAFVVLPITLQQMGGGGQRREVPDTTVVTFKGGDLTQQQIENLRWEHNMLVAFLQEAAQRTVKLQGSPGRSIVETGDSDRELLYAYLLAKQAGELGIVVNNDAVREYLAQYTAEKLPAKQFSDILEKRLGNRISEATLFGAIQRYLAAKSMQDMITSGLATVTPGLSEEFAVEPSRVWEYYGQLNREITAEVLPVNVEDFVDKVDPPLEAQLLELYEKYKERLPSPDSPEPGFKKPHKIKLSYVVGDYKKFLEEEKAKIPEEDIAKYYEEHRTEFPKRTLPPEQPEPEDTTEDGGDGGDGGDKTSADDGSDATETPASDTGTATKDGDDSAKSGDENGASSATGGDEPASTDGDATEKAEETGGEDGPELGAATGPDQEKANVEPADGSAVATEEKTETTPPETVDEEGASDNGVTEESSEKSTEGGGAAESSEAESDQGARFERRPTIDGAGQFVAYFDDTATGDDSAEEAGNEGEQEPAATDEPPTDVGEAPADSAADTGSEDGEDGEDGPATGEAATADEAASDVEQSVPQPAEKAGGGAEPASADADNEGTESVAGDVESADPSVDPSAEASSADTAPEKDASGGTADETGEDAATSEGETTETGDDKAAADEGEKPVEYQTLEEARDKIAGQLAAKAAQERFDRALSLIQSEMADYFEELVLWEALQEDEENGGGAARPKMPDIEALATKHGLKVDATRLVDILEFMELEIGKAEQSFYQIQRGPDGSIIPRERKVRLVADAFGKGVPLYQAKQFPGRKSVPGMFPVGDSDTKYIYWKTKNREEYVPELKEVRDEVVKAWKIDKARDLAQQAAEKHAEKVRKSGVTLTGEFGEDKVVETDAFKYFNPLSLLNARDGQGGLQVDTIDGVEGVGDDFMQTVFDHKAGDVCVAFNEPKTTVYVVRLKTDRPSNEVLRERFKTSVTLGPRAELPYEIQLLAARDVAKYFRSWLDEFDEDMEIDWKREPKPGSQQRRM